MDPLAGSVGDIIKRMHPEDAIPKLNESIATLDRHMRALMLARQQLEEKKEALVHLISPVETFEAEIVHVF